MELAPQMWPNCSKFGSGAPCGLATWPPSLPRLPHPLADIPPTLHQLAADDLGHDRITTRAMSKCKQRAAGRLPGCWAHAVHECSGRPRNCQAWVCSPRSRLASSVCCVRALGGLGGWPGRAAWASRKATPKQELRAPNWTPHR